MPIFENVTGDSGLNYRGRTWSAAWGDIDGNGLPDLWLSRHNSHAITPNALDGLLFVNVGDGRFEEAPSELVESLQRDMHGSAWADFDNDSDQDLAVAMTNGITLFENDGGALRDSASRIDFEGPEVAYEHNVVWIDYNNDGRLDLFLSGDPVPGSPSSYNPGSVIFRQTKMGTFVDANQEVGLRSVSAATSMADVNGDGRPELIVASYGRLNMILDTTEEQWRDISGDLLPAGIDIPRFNDVVIADFDNNRRPDIFLCRSGITEEVVIRGEQIRGYMAEPREGEKSFSFSTTGDLRFTFPRQDGTIDYDLIRVGAAGRTAIEDPRQPSFELSSDDPANIGLYPYTASEPGVYIGYDPALQIWEFAVVGRPQPSVGFPARGFVIDSTSPISDLRTQGFPAEPTPAFSQLLLNIAGHFVDASVRSGIAEMGLFGNNAAAGDFDNDGDVDIYVDQAGPAYNRPNVLLVNQGDAAFVRVQGADGAAGSGYGVGGAVAVADYDLDGFLDIALANGGSNPPFNPLNDDGPLQLFHNLGNSNHWLGVRLHGGTDGIGAKVLMDAGGQIQLREANNGSHIEAQDSSVLHFGLGSSDQVDRLEVRWQSGRVAVQRNVPADQILDIFEAPEPAPTSGTLGLPEPIDATDLMLDPDSTADAAAAGSSGEHLGYQAAEGDVSEASAGDWLML